MTKVLLCLPNDSSYYQGLMNAFNYLQIDVVFFDYRKFSLVEKIIAAFGRRDEANKSLNKRLIRVCKKYNPDLLFVMKGELIDPSTIKLINTLGIKTMNWFPDHVDAFALAKKLRTVYALFYHFDPYALKQLNKTSKKKSLYLPFAADILPGDKQPRNKGEKIYKLTFVGNYNSRREKYLQQVSDLGLHIWGDNRWANSQLKDYYHGYLPNREFKTILSKSLISVNIQHDYPSSGAVLRVLEVAGSGTMLLSEYRRDIANLFKAGKEVALFKSPRELRRQAVSYLSHMGQRNKLAQQAFTAAKQKHTYIKRIKEVLKHAALT